MPLPRNIVSPVPPLPLKGDEIAKLQTSSVSRALEGTVAGLQASAASGQPGTDATIRIRGIGSINASSAPLYVVDGVPYDGSVNSINPEDIASMTVLKDAASAALYGSRGANGVIIITTKQGDQNTKATVKVKASLGGSNVPCVIMIVSVPTNILNYIGKHFAISMPRVRIILRQLLRRKHPKTW